MKPFIWLRSLAVLLLCFGVGHTLGTAAPRVKHGPVEAALFDAMQQFRFPMMGVERSHWDFYRGFAITITVLLFALAVLAWQLARLSREHPRLAFPLAVTLQMSCIGLAVVGMRFFFTAPIVMAWASVGIATMAVIGLWRETRGPQDEARGVGWRLESN